VARIELITRVSAPPERCFDLARSVELHTHSTAATGERAVGGVTRGLLELGNEVTWRARHFGVWQTLTSRITAYDRPRSFRDSMVRGAFRRFEHDHSFEPLPDGGTLMRDVFDYAAPFGPLGRLAEWLFLSRYMRRFLEERNRLVKAVAESEDWRKFVAAV
jgi:ligand-binding SRPBCC domain-containing protein